MPIKRRVAKHRDYPITPETVAAYQAGDAKALRRIWRLKPWQVTPIEAKGPCPWPEGTAAAGFWPTAIDLRTELESCDAG